MAEGDNGHLTKVLQQLRPQANQQAPRALQHGTGVLRGQVPTPQHGALQRSRMGLQADLRAPGGGEGKLAKPV